MASFGIRGKGLESEEFDDEQGTLSGEVSDEEDAEVGVR